MTRKWALCLIVGVVIVVTAASYVFTAPYERFPGVRLGGALTPPPADWTTVNGHDVVLLKLAGFPPFVIRIVYSTDSGGIVTATRPDGGYWAGRVRGGRPDGWIRLGDATYCPAAENSGTFSGAAPSVPAGGNPCAGDPARHRSP